MPAPIRPPSIILEIARRCERAGGRALLVGGCIRDPLMGRAAKDWDLEVYRLDQDTLYRLLKPLGKVNAVGRAFGVLKLAHRGQEIDIAIPRRDSNVGPGHKGIAVQGDPSMTPTEAARRRDLTINAILYDVLRDELLDPFGGLEDLAAGRLRAVDSETFLEDPLRALRVVQFTARLGFTPDAELEELCKVASLDELPAERIQTEWIKLLLKGVTPSTGLAFARRTRILDRVFPELVDSPPADRALDHLAERRLSHEGRALAVGLATWLHETPETGVIATLDRLWLHTWGGYPLRDRVVSAVRERLSPIDSDAALRHLSTRTELEVTLWVRRATTAEEAVGARLDRAQQLGILNDKPRPLLLGRHLKELGVRPGPEMGRILKEVYRQQLDGTVTSLEEAKAAAALP